MSNKITIIRGDTFEANVTVRDEDGGVVDLTGATVQWIIANSQGGSALLTMTIGDGVSVVDAAAGTLFLELTAAQSSSLPSGILWHYVVVTFSASRVKTVLQDNATVVDR